MRRGFESRVSGIELTPTAGCWPLADLTGELLVETTLETKGDLHG
jgi:hypothetical protein